MAVTPRHGSILVVDDEEIMREILETLLSREGYSVRSAASGAEGLELARSVPFDAAIVDVMMPGMDGMTLLDELKKLDDDLPVMMITAYASVENAIAAMKRGAFDYITKPFKNDEVLVVVRNAMERRQLIAENISLRQNLQAQTHNFAGIIGRIIAATNCDLKQMMEAGRFREDLFYRLHVINIFLPPLRQRKDDIPILAQHFLEKYGVENNKAGLELAPEALDLLMDYHWPGN